MTARAGEETPVSPPHTVIVTGYSSAPRNTGSYAQYGIIGSTFEVDLSTRRIVDAEFFVVTQVAQNFLKRTSVGYRLPDDADLICEIIRNQYVAPSANALAIAVKNASRRLADHLATEAPQKDA